MLKAPVQGSDPQTAMAIPEQLIGLELPPDAWQRIRFGFPINKLSDSGGRGDQECPVLAFTQNLGGARGVARRQALGRTRLPSPPPVLRCRPEIVFAILAQRLHPPAETAVLSVALGAASPNRAKLPSGKRQPAGPHRSFTVLKQRINSLSRKLRVLRHLILPPASQPSKSAEPESPISRAEY